MSGRAVVYVICFGERGEGHDPVAAAATLGAARRLVFERYDVAVTKSGPGEWFANVAGSHVDEVCVRRLAVVGAS